MQIKVVGLNHTTSPVEVRERLHFSKSSLSIALEKLQKNTGVKEVVILSTCNRVEIYFTTSFSTEDVEKIKNFLSSFHQVERGIFENSLYVYSQPESVVHLFRVTSGIDSLVIGESQILSQVKEAYKKAYQAGCTGKILNRLFQTSFQVAKLIRTKTGINRGSISVGSVAVELMKKTLGKLSSKKVMVLGAGEISTLVIKHLVSKGIRSIIVSNRSFERAKRLAKDYGGEAIQFEDWLKYVPQVDIVISSTSAPHFLVRREDVLKVMKKRKKQPLFLMDLAIPRDIDPEVRKIPNVFLYNIDHLKEVVESNFHERKEKLPTAEKIINENVAEFMGWFRALQSIPTIQRLSKKAEIIRERELKKTLSKLNNLSTKDKKEIEYLSRRIVNNLLDEPKRKLKEKASKGDGYQYIKAVEELFELNEQKF